MMLDVFDLHTFYGRSHILQGIRINVDEREIVSLLGRNGVGKSTTLKSIIGLTPPRQGRVVFCGREVQGRLPHEISRLGISYVPEDRRVFPLLTVKENLILGLKNARPTSAIEKNSTLERIYEYFPLLKMRGQQRGSTLSGGQQQMLTIARGLMGDPRLMLLDEPFEGLAPLVIKELMNIIMLLCREGKMAILLVEQKARLALQMAQRGYVLEKGVVRCEGTSEFLLNSCEVKERCGL
ncbi:MAG: ABC transporter ATP-binding protein [Pseudomonadota bacterium]